MWKGKISRELGIFFLKILADLDPYMTRNREARNVKAPTGQALVIDCVPVVKLYSETPALQMSSFSPENSSTPVATCRNICKISMLSGNICKISMLSAYETQILFTISKNLYLLHIKAHYKSHFF